MCLLFTQESSGSSPSDGDYGVKSRKKQRVTLSTTEVIAAYFCKKLEDKEGIVSKTKVQKLTYFANGLHYVLTGTPVIHEPFEAHQFGPLSNPTQGFLDEHLDSSFKCSSSLKNILQQSDVVKESKRLKGFSRTVFEIFGDCSAGKLSELIHEPLTPWSQVRPRWYKPLDPGQWRRDMDIPQDMDRQYFSDPITITRFFIPPYVEGKIKKKESTVWVLSELLKKYPELFLSFLSLKLEFVRESIQMEVRCTP